MPWARLRAEGRPDDELEVAVLSTWRERLRGLLGTGPSAGSVMLTLCSSVHTFGMRYDLDLAFVGERGEVLLVCRGVPPGTVRSEPRARCVIERPARPGAWVEEGERLWVSSVSAEGLGAL